MYKYKYHNIHSRILNKYLRNFRERGAQCIKSNEYTYKRMIKYNYAILLTIYVQDYIVIMYTILSRATPSTHYDFSNRVHCAVLFTFEIFKKLYRVGTKKTLYLTHTGVIVSNFRIFSVRNMRVIFVSSLLQFWRLRYYIFYFSYNISVVFGDSKNYFPLKF